MSERKEMDPVDEYSKGSKGAFDLTEEGSSRQDEEATKEARQLESDDINENTGLGRIPTPKGDQWAENKVAVSDDE